jgi:hypothetical protein
MKRYEVKITARVETTEVVMADDEEHACLLAEASFGEAYSVHNSDLETNEAFTEIFGYEPEELA